MVPEVAGSIPVSHPSFFLLDTIRMADILPIYGYGFSVLKRRAESIELPDEAKAAFAESMFATMDASDGVGLAAPQVGVSERLFVIDSPAMIDEESDEQPHQEVGDGEPAPAAPPHEVVPREGALKDDKEPIDLPEAADGTVALAC